VFRCSFDEATVKLHLNYDSEIVAGTLVEGKVNLLIREAKPEDAPAVSKLFSELVIFEEDLPFLAGQIDVFRADPNYYLAVACRENDVVGMAMAVLCQNICRQLSPFMLIENMVVSPDYRRQGIGRQIMLYLEDWARKNNCGFITLVSQHKRNNAHQFYQALGYAHDDGFQKFLMFSEVPLTDKSS